MCSSETEEGEQSIERRSHRRPPKPRMNRSVSEEVLGIEREMNGTQHGMGRNASRTMQGIYHTFKETCFLLIVKNI